VDAIPNATSEKPSVPTLWINTPVVIKLAKIARGEALQATEIGRLTHLRELVQELGRKESTVASYFSISPESVDF
jgi:hypothetical protein